MGKSETKSMTTSTMQRACYGNSMTTQSEQQISMFPVIRAQVVAWVGFCGVAGYTPSTKQEQTFL